MIDFVLVGKIVKPQGIKGEVKVKIFTNNLEAFNNLKCVYLGKDKKEKKVQAVSVRFGFAYIMLEGCTTRNDAEKFRNLDVYVNRNQIKEEENTFLIGEVIGSSVVDENNELIGKLVDVEQYGAADVWVIFADGRNYSVPFIETIFLKVLPNQKLIVVNKQAFDEVKICE